MSTCGHNNQSLTVDRLVHCDDCDTTFNPDNVWLAFDPHDDEEATHEGALMFAVKYVEVENGMEYAWFKSRSDASMFLKLANAQETAPHSEIVEVVSVCGSPLCD